MDDHSPTPLQLVLLVLLVLAAFGVVGQGDYEHELEVENARLQAQAAHCRAVSEQSHPERLAATRGSDLAPEIPRGTP